MEQHPVPQNVTTFQFRLIGDMTLKQFGYLCAGAILAFVAYKLPLPFIITWPLAFAFAFLGVGFAFIPVEERPMDVWVFSFFKSIYNPTQYVWTKEAQKPEPAAKPAPASSPKPTTSRVTQQKSPTTQQRAILSGIFGETPQVTAQQSAKQHSTVIASRPKSSPFAWLSDMWNPKPATHQNYPLNTAPVQKAPVPVTGYKPVVPQPLQTVDTPSPEDAAAIQQKMSTLENSLKDLQSQLTTKNVTSDRVLELQKQLTEVLQQKSSMEDELVELRRKVASHEKPPAPVNESPTKAASGQPMAKSRVTVINTTDQAVKVGLPRLTSVPNVITGLVKDDAGNLLPGILITITNKEGVPVRALKTNKLGQFAPSTPLPSNEYFVEIEDPRGRYTFSRVQLTLTGGVVPAVEIIAKSQKQLTRERLAQEIFGNNSM